MRSSLPVFACTLLLAACGSPPKPPAVDPSQKRPVNSPMAVELQSCRHELQNTRLLALEAGRAAETRALTMAQLALRQQMAAPDGAMHTPQANSVVSVRFALGSTQVDLPADAATALADAAKAAPLVVLRGRTDGSRDSLADSRLARERAAAVRDVLVAAGVDPARIRATYQPVGDSVADNTTASGRALNRRVEIELYRALPVPMAVQQPAATTPQP